eukprot:jgi/Orpsp1_1/1180968/evm.model.c7180000075279.1
MKKKIPLTKRLSLVALIERLLDVKKILVNVKLKIILVITMSMIVRKLFGTGVKPLIKPQDVAAARRRKRDDPTAKWVTADGEELGVYINQNKEANEYRVIYCTSKTSCIEVNGSSSSTEFMNVKKNIIIRSNAEYNPSVENTDKFGFIVDKSTSEILSTPNNNSKLVYCEYKETQWTCSTPSTLSSFYITKDKGLIITSNNAISSVIKNDENMDKNGYNGYYINKSTEIIKCYYSAGCSYVEQSTSDTWCQAEANVEFKEVSYYLVNEGGANGMVIQTSGTGKVYKCDPSTSSCTALDAVSKTYPNYDGSNNIVCGTSATQCSLSTISTSKTYVYCVDSNKLKTCENNCSSDTCTEIVSKDGYYLPYEKDGLISCSSDNCQKVTDLVQGYYKSQDISKQLIRCNDSVGKIRCNYATANNGYYIKTGFNVINCQESKCEEATGEDGKWFLSGDSEYKLVKCSSSNNGCFGISKPKEGWYYDSDNKKLITCRTNKGEITCKNENALYDGNFITATNENYLITCTDNSCNKVEMIADKYYINGENKKLIKCVSNNCVRINDVGYWYIANSDKTGAIKCNNNVCEQYKVANILEGFYLNGDQEKSYKPLLYNNQETINYYGSDIVNGWYVNADVNSDSMIRCKVKNITDNGKTGECVEESFVGSCTTDSAKFVKENGEIKWCVNENIKLPKKDERKEVIVKVKNANTIPWITDVTGSDKVAIFTITSNIISQKKVNGYYYDSSSNELYFCNGSGSGLCEKRTKEGGYYLDYSGYLFYRCDNNECKKLKFDEHDNTKNVGCNNGYYNVVIHGEVCPIDESNPESCDDHDYEIQFSLCKNSASDKTSAFDLSTANIDYVYALENKYFPTASASSRYILVNVNKYSVTYKDAIKEVDECGTINSNARDDIVCLKDNKLCYKKTLLSDANLQTDVEVKRGDNLKKSITYDYETNNGYYKYGYENNKSILNTVYIKKDNSYKYECKIGNACIERVLGVEPITTFKLVNGVLMSQKDSQANPQEIQTKILDGIYIDKSNNEKAIECKNGLCDLIDMNSRSITFSDGIISVNGIFGTGKYKQYLFESSSGNLSKRSVDENYVIMNELTTVQYSEVEDNGQTINIIINNDDHRKITNEVDITSSNIHAYICSGSLCKEVNREGEDKKYLLNSAQKDKKQNAYVVCYSSKCELKNAEADLLFENYAASGSNDALIKCTSEKCEAVSVSQTHGLPECMYSLKSDETKELVKAELTERCIRSTGEVLLEGQHCIMEGKIYDYECKAVKGSGIKLFDGTYRLLDISNINGEHFGATMYDCPNVDGDISKDCYITYGYIVGTNGYSVCDANDCLYYIFDKLDNNCDIAGEGALLQNGKICVEGGESENVDGYYNVNISRKSDFPESEYGDKLLIKISSNSKIMSKIISDGYLLIKSDNQIITAVESDEENKLVKCSTSDENCEIVSNPSNGYYQSDKYGLVIKCDDKCNMISRISIESLGFSESDDKSYYAIDSEFPGSSTKVIAEATKYSITVYKTDNYVLLDEDNNKLAGNSDSLKTLYICNSNIGKCEKKYSSEDIPDGWYVSGQEGIKAIKCTSGNCEIVETLNSSCKYEGDLIYISNQYTFCGKSKASVPLSTKIGEFVTYSLSNVFPNGKNYVVINSNSVIGLGYIDTENTSTISGIAQCTSVSTTSCKMAGNKSLTLDEYCIYVSNGITKIYKYSKKTEEASATCDQQFTEGVNVALFRGNKLVVSATDAVEEGNQMFYCNNGECSITAGYIKIANTFYRCEYGKCSLALGSEAGDVSGTNIYIDSNTKAIEDDKYYFISGSHHFPSAESLDSFIVKTNSNYVVIFNGEGYYLVDSDNKLLSEDPKEVVESENSNNSENNELYYCNGNKVCTKLESSIIGNGYYFNSAIAKEERYKKSIIACNNGSCAIADNSNIIYETVRKCTDVQIGKLVRTESSGNFQEYQMCIKKDTAPVAVKKTDENSSFYVLTLVKDSSFGGINVADDNSKTVVVEIKKDYIKQYNGEGYVIIANNGELLQSVGVAVGTLYNCENKDSDGVKCTAVTTPNNGWYFNNVFQDKRYIKYDGAKVGNYEIVSAKETVKCDSNGNLIFNEGFKLCLSSNKIVNLPNEFDAVMNVAVANTFPGVATDNKNILM